MWRQVPWGDVACLHNRQAAGPGSRAFAWGRVQSPRPWLLGALQDLSAAAFLACPAALRALIPLAGLFGRSFTFYSLSCYVTLHFPLVVTFVP